MYRKSDRRALQSMQWLMDALFSLMEEMPYSQISVRDLCKKADVSRQTFYNLFADKNDLVRWFVAKSYRDMTETLTVRHPISIRLITETFCAIMTKQNREFTLIFHEPEPTAAALQELGCSIEDFLGKLNLTAHTQELDYGVSFLQGGIAQLLLCWYRQEQRISSEELAVLLEQIIAGKFYQQKHPGLFEQH